MKKKAAQLTPAVPTESRSQPKASTLPKTKSQPRLQSMELEEFSVVLARQTLDLLLDSVDRLVFERYINATILPYAVEKSVEQLAEIANLAYPICDLSPAGTSSPLNSLEPVRYPNNL